MLSVVFRRTKVTLGLVALFSMVSLLSMFSWQSAVNVLACKPGNLQHLSTWYSFVTYSWLHLIPYHLLVNSFVILLVALIVEPRLPRAKFLFLYLSAAILGGFTYSGLSEHNVSFIGSAFVINAFQGVLISCWLKNRRDFNRIETVYAYILMAGSVSSVLLLLYSYLVGSTHGLGSAATIKLISFAYGVLYGLLMPGIPSTVMNDSEHGDNQPINSD